MRINHGLSRMAALTLAFVGMIGVVHAATGTSAEFKVDLQGMGPWEMRTSAANEAIAYSSAWATNALDGATAVVKVCPVKREKPKYIAIDLSGGTAATHYPIEYLDEIPGGTWSDEYKTSKLVLRHIPAGSFIMGGRYTDYPGAVNTNLHMVTLTKDFYMGVFEVTQRQWELVMGNRPSAFSNETCYAMRPVECVSYIDIRGGVKGITWPESNEVDEDGFIGKVRAKSGLTGFDLPTEAQWEYASRAGTTTALNNGENITTLEGLCPNANAVARCWWNNDALSVKTAYYTTDKYPSGPEAGTAVVGTYLANNFGLYDTAGNVYEFCLDAASPVAIGCIDPVGAQDILITGRQLRGGSWSSSNVDISSGTHHTYGDHGYPQTQRQGNVGFRLCLQGGEIPETTEGVELVNTSGSCDAAWTPTRSGTYYLTHETQTNGVNAAEVLGAWFKVAGPELTFTSDGELTPGVKVAIGGAGEGWTVRYTTDGSVPTAESPEYTVPITLDGSATVRAVAYSDGGMASEEFSASFSLMSVVNAVAKPRYPWNGKVDIDCEVRGESGHDYAITLEARDLDGGTNLPVRTVVGRAVPSAPQSQANEFDFGGRGATALPPGTYRFTWDADADIAGDCDFANVAVSVKAEGSATVGAKRVVTLTVDGYTGTEVLTNVPTLVRLSTAIEGFNYADFTDANGDDLIFCDETESVIYPHEIDEWHVGGESLVWVKLPEMRQGTKFKAAYGGRAGARPSQKGEVWADYAGVWHMNEDSGTAFDSTAHGLDALPSKGTNTLADIGQMVAYENGACGRARVNAAASLAGGQKIVVPAYDGLRLGSTFVFSGWYNVNDFVYASFPKLVFRDWASGGWGMELVANPNQRKFSMVGGGGSAEGGVFLSGVQFQTPIIGEWKYITMVYQGASGSFYENGSLLTNGVVTAANDNGKMLVLGGALAGDSYSLNGQYDEIRLRGGTLSADRIRADYDMIKNRNFLRYGPVTNGKGVAE